MAYLTDTRDEKNHQNNLSEEYILLQNKMPIRVVLILLVYNELTLSQMSKHLVKTKASVHYHLQKLIKMKLVKIAREEKVRGSILAKYYCLDQNALLLIQPIIMNLYQNLSRLDLRSRSVKGLEP
ncbi:MAG: hypothetical protein ACFFCZ_09645 [Promethearchaeota archaeon]